jgi:hypothetical protein
VASISRLSPITLRLVAICSPIVDRGNICLRY